jgi:hypothetical protein
MTSPSQLAANRLNAQKSAGPISPSGKSRSAMNSLRHGLTARVVVLPGEDMAAYHAFSQEIVESLDAQTPVERQFAQTIADNQWRINRIRSIEDGMFGLGRYEDAAPLEISDPAVRGVMTAARAFRDHSKAFVNLSIYEQRLHRTIKEAFRQLKELQTERRAREEKEATERESAKHNEEVNTSQTQDLPAPAAATGFVYASPEIASDSTPPNPLEPTAITSGSAFAITQTDPSPSQTPFPCAA